MLSETYIKKCKVCKELQALKPATCTTEIWYPTLDELLTLVKGLPQLKNTTDHHLLSKMRCGIAQSCCENYLRGQSMHDFWLLYWMYEAHKKDWYEGRNEFLA
jgi:hypothetical protein